MEHSHSHHEHRHFSLEKGQNLPRSLVIAFLITLGFMGVELVGGLLSNSLVLTSDAIHMLTDAGALLISLLSLWLSQRPIKPGFTYGFQRVEILGALLNGLGIWLIAGFLIFESYERFLSPEEVQASMVVGIASVGLGVNLFVAWLLHRDSQKSMGIRGAYLHVVSDCLGSVGAITAGVAIQWTGARWVDPLVTVFISILMLWSSWRLIMQSVGVLMERVPHHLNEKQVLETLAQVPGVNEVHHLHIWTLSSGVVALSVHVKSRENGVLPRVEKVLRDKFQIEHTTIQVEGEKDLHLEHCQEC